MDFSSTPIQKIDNLIEGLNIYVKREDLLPFSFGGNKVRIAQEYLDDMENKGKNCLIGYGSRKSNLCRCLANLCASKNIPCYIVSPLEDYEEKDRSNNSILVKSCGATYYCCTKDCVSQTISEVINACEDKGLSPYYINGDIYGEGNEATPVNAYLKAYKEICQQSKDMNVVFDYLFLPTGTGMTQAGLIEGQQQLHNYNQKIIGVSIAREAEKEIKIIEKYIDAYEKENKIHNLKKAEINLIDNYLCGGYGKYDANIQNIILSVFKIAGVGLDPVYTGKAFYGMIDYLKKNKVRYKNILFLHTGGLPLFFDFLGDIGDGNK